jgi:hypothetical protein
LAADLDRCERDFDDRDVVFLTEVPRGGGEIVRGAIAECLGTLKSILLAYLVSGLNDSI